MQNRSKKLMLNLGVNEATALEIIEKSDALNAARLPISDDEFISIVYRNIPEDQILKLGLIIEPDPATPEENR